MTSFESMRRTVVPSVQSARNDRYMIYAWSVGWVLNNVYFITWCVPRNSKSGHQLIQNTQAGILSLSPG